MSCNCKDDNISQLLEGTNQIPKISIVKTITKYIFKTLAFLLMIVLLPLINLAIIWFMFEMVVLNKNVDLKPMLISIGKKFKTKEVEDDDEDYDDLTEEDVDMVNVEEITLTSK